MRVLFLHTNDPDYLAESLFHGLRTILGSACLDVPRYDSLYSPLSQALKAKLRGHGFTLYGLLEELPALAVDRCRWTEDLASFDLVVIANIWRQWELAWRLAKLVTPSKIAVLDGNDETAIFPFALYFRHRPLAYAVGLSLLSQASYFKRELMDDNRIYGRFAKLVRGPLRRVLKPQRLRSLGFSIPAEKVWNGSPSTRKKDFPAHIVDKDVAATLAGSTFSAIGSDRYRFTNEADYYADLRASTFGITTKRAGWDCLRHYELAANGCVICFRDLDLKPVDCAPYGLNESNCITYRNAAELMARIGSLTAAQLEQFQINTRLWIERNTSTARAMEFLGACSVKRT